MTTMPVTVQERVPLVAAMPAGGGAGAAGGITPSDVIRALKQRMFLILFIWIFAVGATAGGTYFWAKYLPRFDATAQVLVESPNPQTPLTLQADAQVMPEVQQRILEDQAMLLKSDDVLAEALRDTNVINTQWYQEFPEAERPMILLELQEALRVSPVRGTSYLSVSIGCKSSGDPHVIVNTIVEKYLRRADELSRVRFSEQLIEYKDERETLDKQIDTLRKRKETFLATQLGIPGVSQGLNVVAEALRQMSTEVTRIESERVLAEALHDNLKAVSPGNLSISPEMRMMIENDPTILRLRNTLDALEQNRMLAIKTLGDSHRTIRDMSHQITLVEKQLGEEMAVRADQVRQYEMDRAEMTFLNAKEAELRLKENLLELEDRQRDIDRQLAHYQRMEEEQYRLEENYALLDNHIRMLEMITQQNTTVRVRSIARARMPLERSSPRWLLNMPAGIFLGLALGVGLALLLEFMDVSVRTPRDLARYVHVPVLGTVPDTDDEEVSIDQVELAAHAAPRSMVAEAFRTIRTNLLLSAPAERQRVLLVTSPRPEDGKTTIAVNLAISIAQSGRRVLLVDANFRRPTIQQLFPGGKKRGLSNILIGQAQLDELAYSTNLTNLDVLQSGPIPPNPAELLSSEYMRDLIGLATARYDQVIFDGPPVLLVTDALVLAGIADGVILVCRAKANSRGIAQRAKDQLERGNAHVFGGVLNAAQVRRGGYFREQLRTFYDYQSEDAELASAPALPADEDSTAPKDEESA
ncbi:MAG: polysaccharide biosynthesis tyrosine autokinase [Phycisphaerae bacterium]|nr:polysaccharide biosynthesis tyrosine autokinase [Phycisphaerae bacterium]